MVPAVFLRIVEMEKLGGPTPEDLRKAQETADMLGEHGDILLHGGGKPGQCAELFNRTSHAIAVLAFVPGGVELFGTKFKAKPPDGRRTEKGTMMEAPKPRKLPSKSHKCFGTHSRILTDFDINPPAGLEHLRAPSGRRVGDKQICPGEYGHGRSEVRTRAELRNDAEREHDG